MALGEQRHTAVATTEPILAWLRLFIVALSGVALVSAGTNAKSVSPAWVVILLAATYAGTNSGLGLYKRYRRQLTQRVYVVVDLTLITLLVYLTGGAQSPLYMLYVLPLVVVVLHHGVRNGAYYCASVSVLYPVVATISVSGDPAGPPVWLSHIGLLWGLYLLLGYVTYVEDDREQKAQRRDELGALHRAAAAPMHTGDIPTVIDRILSGVLGATSSCWAAIYLYDELDDRFTSCSSLSLADRDESFKYDVVKVSAADILYTALYSGSPIPVADIQADRRLRLSVLDSKHIRSALLVPLVAPGARKVGILCLGRDRCHRATQHELRFADTLAIQAAVAINTAIVFEEAASIEAAKEADRLRTQLLSTVTHELRTPIAAIQGFASSLRNADGIEIPKEMEDDWIGEIAANADRLHRLVNDLLDLSRLESGALRMALEWQDFADVLDELRPNLQLIAENRNLTTSIGEALPLVRCDGARIGQVLTNLVHNATKFSPPNSNLVIGAERFEAGIRVGVLDEGEGIAPEFQGKVFDRFYQVEGGAYRAQKGTGLGLAICRHIIEAHGGRIWVESSPGKGSIFYFTLPSPGTVS